MAYRASVVVRAAAAPQLAVRFEAAKTSPVARTLDYSDKDPTPTLPCTRADGTACPVRGTHESRQSDCSRRC